MYPGRVDVRGQGLLEVCPVEARGQVALLDLALVVVYRDSLARLVMPYQKVRPCIVFITDGWDSLVDHGVPRLIPEGNIGAQRIFHAKPIQGPHPIWTKRNRGPDLSQLAGPLVDLHVDARVALESDGCAKAGYAGADDGNLKLGCIRHGWVPGEKA